MKLDRDSRRRIVGTADAMFDHCIQTLPFPIRLPLDKRQIRVLIDDKQVLDNAEFLHRHIIMSTHYNFDVAIVASEYTPEKYGEKIVFTLPTRKETWQPLRRATLSHVDVGTKLYGQLMEYVAMRRYMQANISKVEAYIKRITDKCNTYGQLARVMPELRHIDARLNTHESLRISRLPEMLEPDYEARRIGGELLTRGVLAQNLPHHVIRIEHRNITTPPKP